jgi:streptomycin 6-kinase
MESQLEHYQDSGKVWEDVKSLMDAGLDPKTGLITGSRLEEVLKDDANFTGMSTLEKVNWLNELNTNVAKALSWLQGGGALQSLYGEGSEVTFTTADGKTVTGKINANGDVEAEG